MSRSQRHAVYIKGVDAAGKGVAEGVAAPVYVQQFIASAPFTVPLGPPSGPLKGSNLAGFPPTALPSPKEGEEDLGRAGRAVDEGALTDPGQLNLSGNPHYISLPPEGGTAPPEPEETVPILDSLSPATAVLGSEDIVMSCHGSGFTPDSVIYFADQPEPIVFVSENEITTGVKPSLGWGAVTVQVYVQNATLRSAELPFTFTEAEPEADTEFVAPKRKAKAKK